ncbi:VWA domain-containing protein [Peptostreptococcaceae bacterium oral taxon 081]|nr:VWA domain-containing protein [Peptostreptococcaceae bacterium oral taxon 081]
MKVRNRILNIFLAVMLVFTTLLSTNKEVFAATEPSAIDVQNEGNGIAEVKDNEGNMLYKLTKTIEEKDYVSKKATVTIGAEGGSVKSTESTKKKIDIVFLVDTSGSMKFGLDGTQNNVPYKNQRISKLKEALKNSFYLVQLLVKEKNLQGDIRVGLVSFAGESRPVTGLKKVVTDTNPPYDSVNATGWGSSVESLVAEGGTYTDKALSEVSAMFDNNDNKRIVVLMTDGKPTFSTEIKNYSNYEFNDTVTRGDGRNFELIPIMEPAHHINKAEWIEGYFRNCQVPEYWKRKNFWGKLKDKVDSHYVGESWEYIKGYFRNCDLPEYRRPEKNKEEGYFTGDYINVKDNGVAGILRAQMLKDNNTSIYTMGIGANEEELKTYLQALASEPDMFYPDSSANMSNFTQNLKNILYKEISNPTISDETLTDIMGEKVNLISGLDDIKNSIIVSVKNDDSEIAAKRKAEIKKAIEDNLKINNDTITIEKITLAEGESFTIKYDIEPDVDKLAETDYGIWLDANQSATLGQKKFPKPQIKVFMPQLTIKKVDDKTGEALPGAEFSLYKNKRLFVPYKMTQNGYVNINGKITTDSNGTVKVNIPYGQYELKETKAPKDYLINKEEISLNVNDMEIIQEVRNTAIEKVQYSAHKTWQYVNVGELKNYEVEVGLYEEGKTNEPAIDTIILKGNETKQFKEVPKVTQDNKEIKYVVKEIKVTKDGADFTYEQVGNAELNGNNVFELVNKPSDNNIPKVQYGAHKTWQYVNENELNSYEVEVGLYEEGKTNEPAIDTIILKGNETKQFKEVPKVTQDNKEIKYVVKEIKVTKGGANFTYEQVGNAELNGNNVFELVNKPSDNNIPKVQYSAHKTWQYVNVMN